MMFMFLTICNENLNLFLIGCGSENPSSEPVHHTFSMGGLNEISMSD